GNWFPVLAVYRDGRLLDEGQVRGWVRGKYVEIGDAFFSQASDFQVTLTVDRPVEVAHTGDLVRYLDNTWRFEAKGVRDFALAVSRSFSKISEGVDGVQVNVYYLPGHQEAARTYLDAAVQTMYWLSRTVEPYPYEHLDLAEINAEGSTTVGQEYPNLIFMADSISYTAGGVDSYGSTLASHETAHQWFYGLIGNDQLYEPWMDEGMVTWLSYDLLRVEGVQPFDQIWQNRVVNPPIPDLPVNSGIYTYDTEGPYLAAVYRRGAVFLEDIYQAMGGQAFFAALKQYGAAMSGRIGAPFAFLDTMQAHTQVNLNPIVSRYFTYPRYKASEPLRVSAHYPSQVWSETVRVTFDSSAPLQEVRVFIDDALYMTALPAQVVIESGRFGEGPHLLTIRASDGQRETEVIGSFTVGRPAPTPSHLPLPAPTTVPGPQALTDSLPVPAVVPAALEAAPAAPEVRMAGLALITLAFIVVSWGLWTNIHTGGRG
ncbi:MAG: M1 family aminopeptidase, partial [Dehalococcoidia bacterium]|nr:M1 family aminopeptidase [Dehalococcoidia bacterium]